VYAPQPVSPRQKAKNKAAGRPDRELADRADFVAGSIFLFENRDPSGSRLGGPPRELSPNNEWPKFMERFSGRLRGLFHDLKGEELVDEEELPLFYWPQTEDARIRLAMRLREVAEAARNGN
jgi:hypothetical protein